MEDAGAICAALDYAEFAFANWPGEEKFPELQKQAGNLVQSSEFGVFIYELRTKRLKEV